MTAITELSPSPLAGEAAIIGYAILAEHKDWAYLAEPADADSPPVIVDRAAWDALAGEALPQREPGGVTR